ncbi:Uncharacterised protein [Enterobacter cloacae]|nr:Uncharacterised protein [Enterobacter cloacae]
MPPLLPQAPYEMQIFGSGADCQARSAGDRMARVTAPVNSRMSAWRGDGTTLMPKRSASNSGDSVAKISISQPLQPPQSTR